MLYDEFNSYKNFTGLNIFKDKTSEKDDILKNINPVFSIREYQKEALGRFYYYCEEYHQKQKPIHLMFNMATGSGKTLIMAVNILYLYKKGYRNFIFFTRLGNIIQKTKDNFLNPNSKKYLFAEKIIIDGQEVKIKEINNFEGVNDNDINIVFSTTSLLHTRFNSAKESSITYEDFADKKIVLIADEAHNLSAETNKKKLSKEEELDKKSWENTVLKILNSNLNKDNILLEFTATARLDQEYPEILEKYKDKAIFRYDLKEFRLDGFSKDVDTIQIDAKMIERVLMAVVISQYRRKIAEKYKIFLKPVILFKANRVSVSKNKEETRGSNPKIVVSSEFKEKFHKLISNLTIEDLDNLKKIKNTVLNKAFDFFHDNKISLENLVQELKNDFSPERCLTVDDDKELEKKQLLLNSLEDKNNEIRAVFAVEKLNEGWDVLNLFDIVRLYDTRDARENKAGKTTVSEAQLIGRGARYFPFKTENFPDLYRRKFDFDAKNELRILEKLFYYSANNPKYIQELTNVLVKEGIIASNKVEREIKIKDEFKKKDLWNNGLIFLNSRKENLGENVGSFDNLGIKFDYNADWNIYKLLSYEVFENNVFTGEKVKSISDKKIIKEFKLINFGKNVIRSAMDRLPDFYFNNLSKIFGKLSSIDEFIDNSNYLGDVRVKIEGSEEDVNNLNQRQKLHVCMFVLERIFKDINKHKSDYIGEKLFKAYKISNIFKDKKLQLDNDSHRAKEITSVNIRDKDWFAQNEIWGTSEEESFLNFFNLVIEKLENKYTDINLLRNEQHFKIYSFNEGLAFAPDFVLFLREKKTSKELIYQVFIEPKGNQFLDKNNSFDNSQEGWKQKFLLEIESNYDTDLKIENTDFKLIGLPFYNEALRNDFEDSFDKEIID
jgi:type III restriction enzyme